ncbi:hypothetical protein CONLIGDRAFT_620543 [Coniochaeta ligniaria NRRL 30616]|uniref:Uncharacterized protein n=1 Tax=Coniochaeta ligniaria NRRL 30616 TaxID=1408157 RepID=A0A1J7J017_9PEZI|nr:hypothetical protein CONLIGDRAFT_620543 [Coniochaeta ligniaria NRRL 30616]
MHTLQKRTAQLETVEAALQKESVMHSQTQLQLQQKQQEVDDVRKRWRDAANQLDAIIRQGQGVNQMTDDELIQRATALRFKVKNFALQFFGDEIEEPRMTKDAFDFLNHHLRLHLHSFKAYMLSSSFRPVLVRAFLWHYLQYKVFRNCGWAPHDESSAFMLMKWFLEPKDTNSSRVTPDSERKYHMWRANTSTLLLEASAQVEAGASDHRRKFSNGHVRKIYNALSLLSASDSQSIADRLEDIINYSVDLDAQFNKQVAVVQWETIKAPHSAWAFDPTWMEFERGQARTDIVPAIELVLAPALLKYGKSSGDGFETMATLLKLEATSETPLTT